MLGISASTPTTLSISKLAAAAVGPLGQLDADVSFQSMQDQEMISSCCFWQADDRAIKAEGLENLTEAELREACRARGIRGNVYGEGAPAYMRKKLGDWLELSLNRSVCGKSSSHSVSHHGI